MRFTRCVAPIATLVAGCIVSIALLPPQDLRAADRKPVEPNGCTCPNQDEGLKSSTRPKFAELQSPLDEGDEIAALDAIGMALREVGDGTAFVWKRSNGRISGVVKPTSSFKDTRGRICRHIEIVLAAGIRTGKVEGVACRLADGNWELDG